MSLGLGPECALLNDRNLHLVNFYRHVQRGLNVTIEMRNKKADYYACRNRFNELISQGDFQTAEAAQLFYYLNRTCFNGLCRFNQSGAFNVPFGRYETINYLRDFDYYRDRFRQWVFRSGDLEQLKLQAGDFIYADPPYDVEFTSYSPGGFSWEDQVRTATRLASHNGPVVLSNQATSRIIALYESFGFQVNYLDGPRRISSNGDRTAAKEVLACKHI